MKREEYLKAKKESQERIKSEQELQKQLREKYIKANALYNIGERIKVVSIPHKSFSVNGGVKMTKHTERFAFVDGYDITMDGFVKPTLKKEKIDGSISKQSDYFNEATSHIERL